LLKVLAVPLEAIDLLENTLADGRDYFFIAGVSFWPPQAKLAEWFAAQGTQPMAFVLAKPRVIDAKASRYIKVRPSS
jgi:hypothetical protein